MNFWKIFVDLIDNNVLMVALLSWLVAQLLKIIINLVITREFDITRLWGDGGMPSAHSAFVTSAALMCGWWQGFSSAAFGIAIVIAIVVMHDASGVRLEVGKQAVITKELVEIVNQLFNDETNSEIKAEKLKELVGHTPLQVCVGSFVGVCVMVLFCIIGDVQYMEGPFKWFEAVVDQLGGELPPM